MRNVAETEWAFDDPWPTVEQALEAAAVVAAKARELYGDELVEVLLYGCGPEEISAPSRTSTSCW